MHRGTDFAPRLAWLRDAGHLTDDEFRAATTRMRRAPRRSDSRRQVSAIVDEVRQGGGRDEAVLAALISL